MNGKQYRQALKALNLTQAGAAELLGVDERTSRRWAADSVPMPRAASIVLRLMIKKRLSSSYIQNLLAPSNEATR